MIAMIAGDTASSSHFECVFMIYRRQTWSSCGINACPWFPLTYRYITCGVATRWSEVCRDCYGISFYSVGQSAICCSAFNETSIWYTCVFMKGLMSPINCYHLNIIQNQCKIYLWNVPYFIPQSRNTNCTSLPYVDVRFQDLKLLEAWRINRDGKVFSTCIVCAIQINQIHIFARASRTCRDACRDR